MRDRFIVIFIFIFLAISLTFIAVKNINEKPKTEQSLESKLEAEEQLNPLSIEYLKQQEFNGSDIKIEQELENGSNYKRYLTSYMSDGLKIYGLLAVPNDASFANKLPAIVFDHGHIPPREYKTTEKYIAYVDSLVRSGYVVFKIDYRGHDNSDGQAEGAYFSPGYTIDTLNAAESLKKLDYVNPDKIGVWGHSMAGMIVTRAIAAKPNTFKAVVLWGGVVGSYEDIQREWWGKRRRPQSTPNPQMNQNPGSRQSFISEYGEPSDVNGFWKSISPITYIAEMNVPIQLDHGESDETVPVELSRIFYKTLKDNGKTAELYTFPGSDHNISQNFNEAMQHTLEFFDKYLK